VLRENGLKRQVGPDSPQGDKKRRRSLGIYYTPHTAAGILARWAIRRRTDTVLEPSFGGCALLGAAVERLRHLGSNEPAAQLRGFDVDKGAFGYLNRLLGIAFPGDAHFSRGDFLLADPEQPGKSVSAIIANPPFVSWHRMNDQQRDVVRRWRSRYSPEFPMTASLWAYFLLHATHFVAAGGRLAFVLPASAITADYAKSVLQIFRRRFKSVDLFRLNEQLFIQEGAQERAVLLLAENRQAVDCPSSTLRDHAVGSLVDLESAVGLLSTEEPSDPSIDSPHAALETLGRQGNLCAVGDVARVNIGEVVGDTRFFVKTVSEWESIGHDARAYLPLLSGSRQISGVRLTSRDVRSSYSAIPRLLSLPRRRVSKRLQFYLNAYPVEARRNNATFAKRNPWYAVSYDDTAKAFVGSLSHDAPRIVLNIAEISCANGLYKLSPLRDSIWRPVLAAAALSTVTQLSAEIHARARGSGALKLEPSDVRRLALPSSYLELEASEGRRLVERVDQLLRSGEKEAAVRIVDESLLIARGVVSPRDLRILRDQLNRMRQLRLRRTR